MLRASSDPEITSLDSSSPRSTTKQAVYYVQSPSRDSHEEDKSSSTQATLVYNSPSDSPSHTSFSRHSRASSASRFSGTLRKLRWKRNNTEKGWHQCHGIEEEEGEFYGDFYWNEGCSRSCQVLVGVMGMVVFFWVLCLMIWGTSKPYRAQISVKSLTVNNFYTGQGLDFTGVPTKLLTLNSSLTMLVYNPAKFFGIRVSSTPVNLLYYDLTVASGQLQKYYQPKRSWRTVTVRVEGNMIPLYGAGTDFAAAEKADGVPLKLDFVIRSEGDVVGNLEFTNCPQSSA
ncbi:hypothetical protein Ancab_016809 [Ancistrocladus abbreviatus]